MTLTLLNATVKVSAIVLLALAASALLRRQSAAVRHFVLAAALVCAAVTPAVRLVAPVWQSTPRLQVIDRPLAVFDETAVPATAAAARPAAARSTDAAAVLRGVGVVWMTGAGLSVLVLLVGLGRLSWIAAHAQRITEGPWVDAADDIARAYGLRTAPRILRAGQPSIVGTWGLARATILVPPDAHTWPARRLRIVLAHELAHARRRDWIVQTGASLLSAIHWFNPFVHLACRRLRLESEQACDDAVLALGVEGEAYASELVDLARTFTAPRLVPAAPLARPSSLERRVRAMLNMQLNRDPITRRASMAAAVALAAVTVLVAGFGVSAQSQFGSISGSIVDAKGAPLAGATLTLSNAATSSKYEIKSDAAGHYEFVGLPAGDYTMLASFTGFAYVKREGLSINGNAREVNLVMQVGSIEETITVVDSEATRQPQTPIVAPRAAQTRVPPPNPCAARGTGGCIVPPTKIKDVRPTYPLGDASGPVELSATIGVDGRIATLDVVGDGHGSPADLSLADAAATAVQQWEFTPTYLDGEAIPVRMKVHVTFAKQ